MQLPEFNPTNVALFLLAWTLVSVVVGMLIGECIHDADEAELAELADDETWLDEVPVECLSDAEVTARIARIESQMRHPSGREWIA
jgi:hypothetical protein